MSASVPDDVQLFRAFCTTEGAFVTQWAEYAPTSCPNSASHTLDTSTMVILRSRPKDMIARNVPRSPTSSDVRTNSTTVRIPGSFAWRLGDRAPTRLVVRVTLATAVSALTVRCYESVRGVMLGSVTTSTITVTNPPSIVVPLTGTQFALGDDTVYPIEVQFFRASGNGEFTMQDMMLM